MLRRAGTLFEVNGINGIVDAREREHDGRRLVAGRILDDDHPCYHGPTTGAVAGHRFLYLADAFMQLGPDGLVPAAPGRRHAILELPLAR